MTVIKLRGSWTKDQLPNIGITDELAGYMREHRLTRMPFNGILEFDESRDPTEGPRQAIFRIVALEPAMADDGTDPDRRGEQTLQMIDQARKERSLAPVEQTLFDHPAGGYDDEGDGDGVPPSSGEELTAELDERRAARKRDKPSTDPFTPGGDDA